MAIVGIPRILKSILSVRQPAAEDLLARLHVGQDSEDLKGIFEAQALQNLFAEFEVAHWEQLKATFDVGQNSADFKGIFEIQDSEALLAIFTVSKANIPYGELKAHVWISFDDTTVTSQGVDASVLQALTIIT